MGKPVDQHIHDVADAIRLAVAKRGLGAPSVVAVRDLRGGRLAAAVHAEFNIPGFDNSQMDGFAVHSIDLATAAETAVCLPTVAHVVAGDGAPSPLARGTAAPIMTGAQLPAGADAIVRVEDTAERDFGPVLGGGSVTFTDAVSPGNYVRRAGGDAEAGDLLFDAGAAIHPATVGALAAAGIDVVKVTAPLLIAIVSTGSEIAAGQVPDSNSLALGVAVRELGLTADTFLCPDDSGELRRLLDQIALDHDLIITTGGVSMGAREVVRQTLGQTPGAWFGHVNVQPGGPQGLAQVVAAERTIPVVCLPGNPVSALVSFELFLRPPLAESVGLPPWRPAGTSPLAEPLESIFGKLQVRRGHLDDDGRVSLTGGPGSHLVASYGRANLLVLIPEQVTALASGDSVEWWRIA